MYKRKKVNRKYTSRVSSFLAVVLILIGSGLVFLSALDGVKSFELSVKGDANEQMVGQDEQSQKPIRVFVPKIGRTLDVSDGFIEDNRWKISSTGVSYLVTSGKLGKAGNVVLYGHNTRDILGGLWRVQNGDIVEVTAASGKVYKYEIIERKEVKPNQIEILNQTEDSRLTIYTCSGFLDTARFVVVGKLVAGI